MLHWWVTGGQATAIKVFADAFEKTGNHWIDKDVTGNTPSMTPEAFVDRFVEVMKTTPDK